ncbi:MAG: ABC transporter ATP-binding protein [Trueperaceae bacterium]|nr:ABC transporter ATP-binding protein [Trueperaceae bacterium]
MSEPSYRPFAVKNLLTLLKPYRWKITGLSLLIAFSAGLDQVSPQFVRIVIDDLIPRGELRLFLYLALGILVFYIVNYVVSFFAMFWSFVFTQNVISDLRMRAYSSLLALPMARFTKERSGSMVSRVVADVNALESMIQAGASRIIGQLFSILVALIILFSMNWVLALIALAAVSLMAFITLRYQAPLRPMSREIRNKVGEMTAVASEAIMNIGVVKNFANEKLEHGRFGEVNSDYVQKNIYRRRYMGIVQTFSSLSSDLGMSALLLIGGWFVVRSNADARVFNLTTGELTAFLLYLRNLMMPVRFVMDFNAILQSGLAALDRVEDLLEERPEDEGDLISFKDTSVVLQNIHFQYPEAETEALRGLSLAIKSGETVALVGPSGAGKSTVTKLLSRLYDPQTGTIQIGGEDLKRYQLGALRNAIAHVPQDPTLFSGTVKDNIRYAKPSATDAEVINAAKSANAHLFISDLPKAYDTEIGERGVKLSGGQKQRIAIARAILKDASILVLDEATSSLDSESEALIQEALDGLFKTRNNITSIVIAHRLSTIQGADKIFVLDAGRLVEEGSHAELIKKQGLYQMLYELQYNDDLALQD